MYLLCRDSFVHACGLLFSSSAAEADTNNRLRPNRVESYGSISQIAVRENSQRGAHYYFYPNPLNGKVSVYAQEDKSYGSMLYSVTNQYSHDNIYLPYAESLWGISGLGVEASFIVYSQIGFNSTVSIYDTMWNFFQKVGSKSRSMVSIQPLLLRIF